MAKKEKTNTMEIYLEGGDIVELEYPDSIFEEVYDEILKSMKSGDFLGLDDSYDVTMLFNGNYLALLNGRKIVGISF